jgi:hypothetical protein
MIGYLILLRLDRFRYCFVRFIMNGIFLVWIILRLLGLVFGLLVYFLC